MAVAYAHAEISQAILSNFTHKIRNLFFFLLEKSMRNSVIYSNERLNYDNFSHKFLV